jgi:ferrochelatase
MSDAVLILSFGGPESPDEVIPFLENVLRGRNVPRERILEVAGHYYHFGGRSPINEQNRRLMRELEAELAVNGLQLPVYWGNRNWHPLLPDTLRTMSADGITRAFAFVTSAYSSYSGCRQYKEDIARASSEVGPGAPVVEKLRVFFNHPGFIEPMVEQLREALSQVSENPHLLFTAHSIPVAMAETSDYVAQLEEVSRLIASACGQSRYRLVYQSRSGPPMQTWLEPDIGDALREIAAGEGTRDVVLVPVGFTSDHMEVLYDLDYEAKHLADELGLRMVRSGTAGSHPRFVQMIRELVEERLFGKPPLRLGSMMPGACDPDCCPAPKRS